MDSSISSSRKFCCFEQLTLVYSSLLYILTQYSGQKAEVMSCTNQVLLDATTIYVYALKLLELPVCILCTSSFYLLLKHSFVYCTKRKKSHAMFACASGVIAM